MISRASALDCYAYTEAIQEAAMKENVEKYGMVLVHLERNTVFGKNTRSCHAHNLKDKTTKSVYVRASAALPAQSLKKIYNS